MPESHRQKVAGIPWKDRKWNRHPVALLGIPRRSAEVDRPLPKSSSRANAARRLAGTETADSVAASRIGDFRTGGCRNGRTLIPLGTPEADVTPQRVFWGVLSMAPFTSRSSGEILPRPRRPQVVQRASYESSRPYFTTCIVNRLQSGHRVGRRTIATSENKAPPKGQARPPRRGALRG